MATTSTYTATFARLELIKMQVRIALRRTTNISQRELSSVEKALDKHWINKVIIPAVDSQGYCRAQLILEIDWNEHDFQLSQGKAIVSIDEEKWVNNTAIEVDEVVKVFNDFVYEKGLTTEPLYQYLSDEARDKARKELGWVDADPLKWAAKKGKKVSLSIPELSELSAGVYLETD